MDWLAVEQFAGGGAAAQPSVSVLKLNFAVLSQAAVVTG